jgi:hypothetical protein
LVWCLRLFRTPRSPADRLLQAQIFLFAAGVPVLMRLALPTVDRLLRGRGSRRARGNSSSRMVHIVDSVLARGGGLIRQNCLTRGLTRYYFLRRAGVDVCLCFGIGNIGGTVVGHCWLVQNGEPVLEGRDPRLAFREMYRFPGGSETGQRSLPDVYVD